MTVKLQPKLVGTVCLLIAAAGCGSGSSSDPPQVRPASPPAVAARVIDGDRFLGLPAIYAPAVRTDPGELSADLPGFYADPEKAVADLRQVHSLLHQPCPPGLAGEQDTERFDVPGIPGAAGMSTTLTIKGQQGSLHPEVLRADAIVFRDDAFVEQVFLGTERPSTHRPALIRAAQDLYQRARASA